MNLVIFEDEAESAERLMHLLRTLRPHYTVWKVIPTVAEGIAFFDGGIQPDLVFMDIHLADDSCFAFFEHRPQHFPVVFTTAYDQYAIKAFKVNSIDYLLKPIEKEELARSLEKFERLQPEPMVSVSQLEKLAGKIFQKQQQRFTTRINDQLLFVKASEIAYLYSQEGSTWAVTFNGQKLPLEYSLEHFEKVLDASQFFRISRKFIVHLEAIKKIQTYFNNRYQLSLSPAVKELVLVSRERTHLFKSWIEG